MFVVYDETDVGGFVVDVHVDVVGSVGWWFGGVPAALYLPFVTTVSRLGVNLSSSSAGPHFPV